MKKILCILSSITLIETSTTSLVACNTSQYTYTEKELADLKEKNNINTKDGVLEWIAAQEKPFIIVDNKWSIICINFHSVINWFWRNRTTTIKIKI